MGTDWIPGAGVGIVGSAVAWILSWRIASANSDGRTDAYQRALAESLAARQKVEDEREARLRAEFREMRDDWRAGVAIVNKVNDNVVALQAKQNAVNEFNSQALASLADKCERHDQLLADHTSTLRLLTDVVMSRKNNTH